MWTTTTPDPTTTTTPGTPSPSATTVPGTGDALTVDLSLFLWITVLALVVIGGIHLLHVLNGKTRPLTLVRILALMFVVAAAVVLVVAEAPTEAKTAAFTLLGTIAGYLAGTRSPTTTTTTTPGTDPVRSDGTSTVVGDTTVVVERT